MRLLSHFVASTSVLSFALLLCDQSGTAMSQTATPSGGEAGSLPSVLVEAPKQIATRETARSRSQRRVPSDNANHSEVIGAAAVTGCAACEGRDHWQLRRWVRNELPVS